MNRREWLGTVGAVAVGAALTRHVEIPMDEPPRLWQDGVHDDAPWLQWQFDHGARITGQQFWIGQTVFIGQKSGTLRHLGRLEQSALFALPGFRGYMLDGRTPGAAFNAVWAKA